MRKQHPKPKCPPSPGVRLVVPFSVSFPQGSAARRRGWPLPGPGAPGAGFAGGAGKSGRYRQQIRSKLQEVVQGRHLEAIYPPPRLDQPTGAADTLAAHGHSVWFCNQMPGKSQSLCSCPSLDVKGVSLVNDLVSYGCLVFTRHQKQGLICVRREYSQIITKWKDFKFRFFAH